MDTQYLTLYDFIPVDSMYGGKVDDNIGDNFDGELFEAGMNSLTQCYEECLLFEQTGGRAPKVEITKSSKIIGQIFSPKTKSSITRAIRGILRTSAGISADILTLGAGGDVIVNSLFAVESSLSFIANMEPLLVSLAEAQDLFSLLIKVDRKSSIPIKSRIKLDNGFGEFENVFDQLLIAHIGKHGAKMLDSVHLSIVAILDKITTSISDWIACLFPDTAGLAGEIAKSVLDYISLNGYSYIYQLVAMLNDNMQKMITNPYALENLVRRALTDLRNIILTMDTKQIVELVQSIGVTAADFTGSTIIKTAVRLGSITGFGLKHINLPSNFATDKARQMLAYIIDKYVIPNADEGVALFYQLFPIFLMFTLFIEKYPLIMNQRYLLERK